MWVSLQYSNAMREVSRTKNSQPPNPSQSTANPLRLVYALAAIHQWKAGSSAVNPIPSTVITLATILCDDPSLLYTASTYPSCG